MRLVCNMVSLNIRDRVTAIADHLHTFLLPPPTLRNIQVYLHSPCCKHVSCTWKTNEQCTLQRAISFMITVCNLFYKIPHV